MTAAALTYGTAKLISVKTAASAVNPDAAKAGKVCEIVIYLGNPGLSVNGGAKLVRRAE